MSFRALLLAGCMAAACGSAFATPRKPLVLNTGQQQQLQAGDSLTDGSGNPYGFGSVTSVVCPNGTITTTGSCNPLASNAVSGDVITGAGAEIPQDSGVLLSALARLASPTFTGTVTVPTLDATTLYAFGSTNLEGSTNLGSGSCNYVNITGAATGNAPSIDPTGCDSNVGVYINPKGAGQLAIAGGATGALLIVGTAVTGSTSSPTQIEFDNTFSSTPGTNFKLNLYGGTYGLGVSANQLDIGSNGAIGFFCGGVVLCATMTSGGVLNDARGFNGPLGQTTAYAATISILNLTGSAAPTNGFNLETTNTVGVYENSSNVMIWGPAGIGFGASMYSYVGGGPAILDANASCTTPTLVPNRNDYTSGIGSCGSGDTDLIAAGVDLLHLVSTGASINLSTGPLLETGQLTIQNVDGTFAAVYVDASASTPNFGFARTDGTFSSKSALGSAEQIGKLPWVGFDGTAMQTGANLFCTTTAAWVHGTTYETKCQIQATPTGSTSTEVEETWQGGVAAGSGSPMGVGTYNAPNGYYVGSTAGVTCSGTPTSSFASTKGIITHC